MTSASYAHTAHLASPVDFTPPSQETQRLAAGTHIIDRDTTFKKHLIFEPGSLLAIGSGVVVTFEDGFTAEDRLIFSGQGTVRGIRELTPEWFGAVGDGTADDTLALQRALDSFLPDQGFSYTAPKHNHRLLLRHRYRVSSLQADSTYLEVHAENAWLIAMDTGSHPHLIRFTKHFCSITGKLSIEGSYNLGYECMIHIDARHFIGNDITIWRASLGWIFGNRNWATSGEPGASELGQSEIVIKGSKTVHCLRGVEAIGSNTIIVFANALIYSYPWTLPKDSPHRAAWESADTTLVRAIGALIYFQGGKLANFNPRVPLIEVQPIRNTKRQYYSNYGGVGVFNAHIEAGNIFATVNPHQIPTQDYQGNAVTQKFASLQLISCTGYATGENIPIKTDPLFTGTLIVNNCNFYGDQSGLFARLENPKATLQFDNVSIRNKWAQGLSAVEGGTLFFSNRLILDVRASQQTLGVQPTRLIFSTLTENDDTRRFNGGYNAQTGEFTVPAGGLENVQIQVGIHFAEANRGDISDLLILRNGQPVSVGQVHGRAGSLRYTFPQLDAGDVLAIHAASTLEAHVLAGDAMTYFQIVASRH